MKIAAISTSRIPSSSANSIQVMKACQALAQLDHEITLYVPRHRAGALDAGVLSDLYGLDLVFPIESLGAFSVLRGHDFAWSASLHARNKIVDLVVAWPLQAALASKSLGIPTILEMHGPPEGRFGPSMFRLFMARPGKKRLVFITRALQKIVEGDFPDLDLAPISCVAPNGVELERYAGLPDPSSARQMVGLPDRITAAYSGHLYPGRGMELLLELARRIPAIQFLWIGGRPEQVGYWQSRLDSEALSNVSLVGFLPNRQLPLYQAAADILLMPYERVITGSSGGNSAGYASPMKMFEYMACRRPILSSDLDVIREVLSQNNAILCPPQDVDAWTEKFHTLLENQSLRDKLAEQAFQDVQAYTWKNRARRMLLDF
jgi:glycosyltransferase involved in cell wall biosynthesis